MWHYKKNRFLLAGPVQYNLIEDAKLIPRFTLGIGLITEQIQGDLRGNWVERLGLGFFKRKEKKAKSSVEDEVDELMAGKRSTDNQRASPSPSKDSEETAAVEEAKQANKDAKEKDNKKESTDD